MYGLTLLAAIGICIWITGHRFVNRGGDWDLIFRCAVWGVGAGIVGARLYHLATSWNEVPDQWWGPFAIWKGGLGVWGGIAARLPRRRLSSPSAPARTSWLLADCLAPGPARRAGDRPDRQLVEPGALRQADRPSVGPRDRRGPPAARDDRPGARTTRPSSTSCSGTSSRPRLLVYVIERRFHPRPPGLFALYIALYSFGRFWIELVRVDPANHILGPAVNTWVSALVCIAGARLVRALAASAEGPKQAGALGAQRAAKRAEDGRAEGPRPTRGLGSARGQCRPRSRAGPRRVRGPVRPPPDAAPQGRDPAVRDRHGRDRRRVRRASRRARRARPRRVRRVPRPHRGPARAEGAPPLPRGGGRARPSSSRRRRPRSSRGGSPSTAA